MGARQRERAKARNRPARRSTGFVREWGTVSTRLSAFQAFFRVIAFSRLPEMLWEHGTAPRRRGGVGSAMEARQRERAKARNRPARRSKGFVREWGTVSSRRLHFRPSFALSRFRDYPRCSENTAQHRDSEAALVRRWKRDSAKGRKREIDQGGEVRDPSGNGARCRLGVCISGLLSRYRVFAITRDVLGARHSIAMARPVWFGDGSATARKGESAK
jgi:hypothetical protein